MATLPPPVPVPAAPFAVPATPSPLVVLPAELRNKIYGYLRDADAAAAITDFEYLVKGKCSKQPHLLTVCRQLRSEASTMYMSKNRKILVRIGRKQGMPHKAMERLSRLVNFSDRVGRPLHIIIHLVKLQWATLSHVLPIAMFIHKHGAGDMHAIDYFLYDGTCSTVLPKDFDYDGYRVEFHLPWATTRLNEAILSLMSIANKAHGHGRSSSATRNHLKRRVKELLTTGIGKSMTDHLIPHHSGLYFLGPKPSAAPTPTPSASTQHTTALPATIAATIAATPAPLTTNDTDHSARGPTPLHTFNASNADNTNGNGFYSTLATTPSAFTPADTALSFPTTYGHDQQAYSLPVYGSRAMFTSPQPAMQTLHASGAYADASVLFPDGEVNMSVLELDEHGMSLDLEM